MAEAVQQFGNIILGTRTGVSSGQLRITPSGFVWKKGSGGKTLEIGSKDVDGLVWTRLSRGCQLSVRRKDGNATTFIGFKDKDVESVREAVGTAGLEMQEQVMGVSGRNWGSATIDGSTLLFRVADKPAFQLPLKEVSQVNQGKDEVMLEFPVDDTTGDREDALVEMSFYIPKDNPEYAGDEETPACKVFMERIMQHTDVGAAVGEAVTTFENVAVLAPRGRFAVEMYLSFMKLVGQNQDYRIQYDSIVRLFILPKTHTPHTLVVVTLDPPIRKGNTFYAHLLCQFHSEETSSMDLDISQEALAAKNEACGGKLQSPLAGPTFEVFARALRGLANTKLIKPGTFRTADGLGYGLRCSYKADDGYLYPLERAFFYVHKPPLLLVHDEIEGVEFMRQGGGGALATSVKTFDLAIRMKNDQEYLFRGIQRGEWVNLFSFLQAKRLNIENLREAEQGPGGGGRALDLGEDIDAGFARLEAQGDSDEEDEDFEAEGGESDDDDDDIGSGSDADADAAEEAAPKAKKKRPPPEAKPPKEPKKAKVAEGGPSPADAKGGKKKRAKKDKNAPKKGLSAFMFFSNAIRDQVKADNPGIPFGEVGKVIGAKWKELPQEGKAQYEAQAAVDKERYAKENAAYKAAQVGAGGEAAGEASG